MEVRERDVVTVTDSSLGRVRRHHAVTGIIEQKPRVARVSAGRRNHRKKAPAMGH
jgi:hypothetical protein